MFLRKGYFFLNDDDSDVGSSCFSLRMTCDSDHMKMNANENEQPRHASLDHIFFQMSGCNVSKQTVYICNERLCSEQLNGIVGENGMGKGDRDEVDLRTA